MIAEIKSLSNPLIKGVCKLSTDKKERQEKRRFVAEGLRFCQEILDARLFVESAFITHEFFEREAVFCKTILDTVQGTVYIVSKAVLKKMSDTENPAGVLLVCEMPKERCPGDLVRAGGRYICLEDIRDPGNLGTIIRTAEALGMDGLLLVGDCADVYNPKVLRATMGSVLRLKFAKALNIEELEALFAQNSIASFAATLSEKAQKLSALMFPAEGAAVWIGNEAKGLSTAAVEACPRAVIIDMPGDAESLNAASAASILMWELFKQKRGGRHRG